MAGSSPASAELLLPQHPTSLNTVQLRQSYRGCYFLRCHFVGATNTLPWRAKTPNKGLSCFKLSEPTLSLTQSRQLLRNRVNTPLKFRASTLAHTPGVPQFPQAALGSASNCPVPLPLPPSRRSSARVDRSSTAHPPGPACRSSRLTSAR